MDKLIEALVAQGMTESEARALLVEVGFSEAGARHAASDRSRLDDIIRLLTQVRDGDEKQKAAARKRLEAKAREHEAEQIEADGDAEQRLAAAVDRRRPELVESMSFGEIERLISDELNGGRAPGDRLWPSAVYDDRFIYTDGAETFERSYAIVDGKVTLGAPVEVRQVWQRVAEASFNGSPTLLEAIEPDGSIVDVLMIQSGLSQNRRRYRPEVLREAVDRGVFEGARSFVPHGGDHWKGGVANGGGRGVRELVGWFTNTRYAEIDTPKGKVEGVAGHYHISEAAGWLRSLVADAFKRGKPDLIGYSIVGDGKTKVLREAVSRRPFVDVERVDVIESVDPVVNPAAGGVALRLVASKGGTHMEWEKLTLAEAVRGLATGTIIPDDLKQHRPDLAGLLEEGKLTEATTSPPPAAPVKTDDAAAAAATGASSSEVSSLVEAALAPFRTSQIVAAKLAERKLPEIAAARIREATANQVLTEADVDRMIEAEADYLAKINPAIVLDAGAHTSGVTAEQDKYVDAIYESLAGTKNDSVTKMYIDLTGDHEFTGKLQESGRLSESISTATFAEIFGDSITRRMLDIYRLPDLSIWRMLTGSPIPLRDFRQNRRIRMGGYGNLPAVAQGDPYLALASPTDEEATYAPTKRGGTEDLTLEAIANDDLQAMRRIPIALGRSAAFTLLEFVFDFLRTNPAIYDGVALFHATHANLGAVALDATSLKASRLRMVKQTEPGSAKRLGLQPKYLFVPADLEDAAQELTQTDREVNSANNTLNVIRTWGLTPVTVHYWTDANNWFLGADPSMVPTVELGFFQGREEPELFLQDDPKVGNVFTNDKLTYKIRHIYGGAVVDFRGLDGSVVA